MPSRRHLLTGMIAAPVLLSLPARAALITTDDGMPSQTWFLNTFLHLPEDAAEAAAQGKVLAVVWEQKGCPGCIDLHKVNFADAEIADYAQAHFNWIGLNIHGDREVTGLDGEAGTEKQVARSSRATFTPIIQFIAPDPQGGPPREIARMPGYLKPPEFAAMLRYVAEGHWRDGDFPTYLKTRSGA